MTSFLRIDSVMVIEGVSMDGDEVQKTRSRQSPIQSRQATRSSSERGGKRKHRKKLIKVWGKGGNHGGQDTGRSIP